MEMENSISGSDVAQKTAQGMSQVRKNYPIVVSVQYEEDVLLNILLRLLYRYMVGKKGCFNFTLVPACCHHYSLKKTKIN